MNINELTSAQMYALLLKIEYWIPSIIATHHDRTGTCPWCGEFKAHHRDCNLNRAIIMYMDAGEAEVDSLSHLMLLKQAETLAVQALKELRYIGDGGYIFLDLKEMGI